MNQDPLSLRQTIRQLLARRPRRVVDDPGLTCAAVLVPLLCKEGEWHLVVTQRTDAVEHHKGQISFPGGACDPGDADRVATALRETLEEIGVPPEAVEVLGLLDDCPTVTGFVVTPVVGVIPYPFPYRLNDREVEAVVEVPLSFLRDPAHLRVEQREYQGRLYDVHFWDYGPYTIWGATARILKGLLDLMAESGLFHHQNGAGQAPILDRKANWRYNGERGGDHDATSHGEHPGRGQSLPG